MHTLLKLEPYATSHSKIAQIVYLKTRMPPLCKSCFQGSEEKEPNGKRTRLSSEPASRKEEGGEASSSGGGGSADPARDGGASEGNSGEKVQEDDGKRKRYHRHSLHQIEELER